MFYEFLDAAADVSLCASSRIKEPERQLGLSGSPDFHLDHRKPMTTVDDGLPIGNPPQPNNQPEWVRILNSRRSRAIASAVGATTAVIRLAAALFDLLWRHRE
jgi:hypothetical protein